MHITYAISVLRSADYQLTLEGKILNLELSIFCVDYITKIRSGLSITVVEKKSDLTENQQASQK